MVSPIETDQQKLERVAAIHRIKSVIVIDDGDTFLAQIMRDPSLRFVDDTSRGHGDTFSFDVSKPTKDGWPTAIRNHVTGVEMRAHTYDDNWTFGLYLTDGNHRHSDEQSNIFIGWEGRRGVNASDWVYIKYYGSVRLPV